MPRSSSQPLLTPPKRIPYLDGLRGLAALLVVLFHYWESAARPQCLVPLGPYRLDLLAPIPLLGGSRVSLFFVLSGFVLYLPFARAKQPEQYRIGFASWLWRRARRIGPAYYVALVFALMPILGTFYLNEAWRWLHGQPLRPNKSEFLLDAFPECLFFAHGLVPGSESPAFNGPLWTVTPEVQLYLTFPLLIVLARRIGPARTTALAVGSSVLYRLWLYREIGYALPFAEDSWPGSAYHCLCNTFLGRWAEFALGMWTAEWVSRKRLPSFRVLTVSFVAAMTAYLYLRNAAPMPGPLTDAVGGITFSLLLLCCAGSRRLSAGLAVKPLAGLGTISYSLYLLHVPVLCAMDRLLITAFGIQPDVMGARRLFLNLLVGLPLALLTARVSCHFLERPFLSAGSSRSTATDRYSVLRFPTVLPKRGEKAHANG